MYHQNIKKLALENTNFRTVVYTGKFSQLVLMSIPVGGDIGEEIHPNTDQILFLVDGVGETIINGESSPFLIDEAVFVPAGTKHNFVNKGTTDLKLYTVYAPPNHKDGTVHRTKAEAEADENDHY